MLTMLYGLVNGTLNFLSLGIGQNVAAHEPQTYHCPFEDRVSVEDIQQKEVCTSLTQLV